MRRCMGERKYLGSGFASKMSDNVDAFSILWEAKILAVKHLPLKVIPQVIKDLETAQRRCPVRVSEKPANVFKQYEAWVFGVNDAGHVKEEFSALVAKALSASCNGKALARKACAKEVKVWQTAFVD